jgi:retinol dehydrogenase-12
MGGPPSLTPSGYEVTFGTNHVGHALLLKLLFPLLLSTPSPRVIFTSSRGHKHVLPAGGIAFDSLKTAQKDIKAISKYTSSKLANIVYARQVAKRYPQITCVAIHPEDVATQLFSKGAVGGGPEIEYLAREVAPKVGVSVEEGSKNGLWAATAEGVESGRYYEPVGVLGMGSELSRDEGLEIRLWEWTERELEGVEV